jgi:hypothetical protein
MLRVRENLRPGASSRGIVGGLVDAVEALLDAGDAVTRRKRANRIYADLAAERISHERAALELQALNKRQHGGWLRRQLEAFQATPGGLGLGRERRSQAARAGAATPRTRTPSVTTPAGEP